MAMLALPYQTEDFATQVLAKDHFSLVRHQDYPVPEPLEDFA